MSGTVNRSWSIVNGSRRRLGRGWHAAARCEFAHRPLRHPFEVRRTLAARYSLKRAMEVFPAEYKELLSEMLHEPTTERRKEFVEAIVAQLLRRGRVLHLVHLTGRLI